MNFFASVGKFFKTKLGIAVIVAAVVVVGGYFLFFHHSTKYQFVTVTRGSITQTVSLTGNTTPADSVSLGFQNSGTIAEVYHALGDTVYAGQVIASLNTASLEAALQQAQAGVDAAQAKLDGLKAGTRPEQIAVTQGEIAGDQAALANAVASAYPPADSAVRTTVDQFISNPRSNLPQLTFATSDQSIKNAVQNDRATVEPLLVAWAAAPGDVTLATSALSAVTTLLTDSQAAITRGIPSTSVPQSTLDSYAADVGSARSSVTGAISSITNAHTTLGNAQQSLALEQAGSTPEDIAAQQAAVEQAQAGVASAEANLAGAQIVAPISGVLTQVDAKVGQLATPGTSLVSIIGTGGFEVDAGVSETDVGKVAEGNVVTMTLDAFPNETFTGKVFYIAPAETNVQGVISYAVKVAFDKPDPRLKSGLTANIDIQTKVDTGVLILPQYAILENDSGTFVETLQGSKATTTPVTLGIEDQQGNVEILAGVTEGEKVLNIGLKQ